LPDFEFFGGFDPVGFEFLKSGLGGTPTRDGDDSVFFGEVITMFADDFAEAATEEVPSDGFACFFRGDESKAAV